MHTQKGESQKCVHGFSLLISHCMSLVKILIVVFNAKWGFALAQLIVNLAHGLMKEGYTVLLSLCS